MGRYASTSVVSVVQDSGTPDADEVRQLFETIGSLYALAERTDEAAGSGAPVAVDSLAGFLDEVRRAVVHRTAGRAMLAALNRYEAARNPRPREG